MNAKILLKYRQRQCAAAYYRSHNRRTDLEKNSKPCLKTGY